jgi:hypothetical protein
MTKYAVVSTVSMFRIRYAIPIDELQQLNPAVSVEGKEIEWAHDCITCNEVNELSQLHLSEQIVDTVIVDAEGILKIFDADNQNLSDWPREQKLEWIKKNWKV